MTNARKMLTCAGALAWIVGGAAILSRVDLRAGACDAWVAPGEPVYVSDWQREHCVTIRVREIPTTAKYNP